MKYAKPEVLNVKRASHAIMGFKQKNTRDGANLNSTDTAYQSDE